MIRNEITNNSHNSILCKKKTVNDYLTHLTYEACSGSSVGSPLAKAFHWGRSKPILAALPTELRSCLMESAHLVLEQPLGLFQPWIVGLKWWTISTGMEAGMRWRYPNHRRRRCRRRDDTVRCLVRSRMLQLLMCCCQNRRKRRLWQRMSNTSKRRRSARVVDHASEP